MFLTELDVSTNATSGRVVGTSERADDPANERTDGSGNGRAT